MKKNLGILEKTVLAIFSTLIVTLSVMTWLLLGVTNENSNRLTTTILNDFEQGNKVFLTDIGREFGEIADILKSAEAETRNLVTGLYDSNYTGLLNAVANQAHPLVENFDYPAAKRVMESVTNENKNIVWMAITTSEKPQAVDVIEVGKKTADANTRTFSKTEKEPVYIKVEMQANLSGLEGVDKVKALFKKIEDGNQHIARDSEKQVKNGLERGRTVAAQINDDGKATLSLWIIGFALLVLVLIGAILTIFIRRTVVDPIKKGVEFATRMASGDLTAYFEVRNNDEIGTLAEALNNMNTSLRQMVQEITQRAKTLDSASAELSGVAGTLSKEARRLHGEATQVATAVGQTTSRMDSVSGTAGQMSHNMNSVSSAADQMSGNMNTISTAAEEAHINLSTVASATEEASVSMVHVREAASRTSQNVAMVAAAVQEMGASLGAVRTLCEGASSEADQAATHAQETFAVMEKLASSAQEIDKAVEMIKSIADQTNMLALNASIESAGAGEAGKGFAVVANEVKELARRTTEATSMIATQIATIQDNSKNAGDVSRQVSEIIAHLRQSNTGILRSVEEQAHALESITHSMRSVTNETNEVTNRVAEASCGIEEVSRSVQEISSGIGEVTRNVLEASSGVADMTRSISETSIGVNEVSDHLGEAAQATHQVSQSMNQVHHAAQAMGQLSTTVDERSKEMTNIAAELNSQLARFIVDALQSQPVTGNVLEQRVKALLEESKGKKVNV